MDTNTQDFINELNNDYTIANTLPIDVLKTILEESETLYYNGMDKSSILLFDEVYDYAKEVYRTKSFIPKEPLTGMEHVPKNKCRLQKLPVWMGSTNKMNHGDGQLGIWINKFPGPYVVSAKMDGASALYTIKNGKYKLYSRGNGHEGQDISQLLQYLKLPPLEEGYMIRGELIIKKSVFESKFKRTDPSDKQKFRNSRNAVAGLVNRIGANATKVDKLELSTINKKFIRNIEFIPYEVITNPPIKCGKQFDYLSEVFQPARHEMLRDISDNSLSDLYDKYIKELDYEIDGLVVCSNYVYERPSEKNPDYMKAYKKPLAILTGVTEVLSVEWNVSKDSFIKPVVIFGPIELDGVTITRASGYNAKNIFDNEIGPGAVIEVTRAGGVIPKIITILEPAHEIIMPELEYEWNETGVDIVVKYNNNNKFSDERRIPNIKKLHYFLVKIGTKGIGEKTVEEMYDNGIMTIPEFFTLDISDIRFLGPKKSKNVIKTIQNNIVDIPTPVLLAASGVFGRLLGVRRFKILFEDYPNILELFRDLDVEQITGVIADVDGFAYKTAVQVAEGFDKFYVFLKELEDVGFVLKSPDPVDENNEKNKEENTQKDHELNGKNIVLTGFRDKEINNFIERVGGNVKSSISGTTNILIIKNDSTSNKKTETAHKRGIKIITKQTFIDSYL